MKKILFGAVLVELLLYILLVFKTLLPGMKNSIAVHAPLSTYIFMYSFILVPALLSLFFTYKCYASLDNGSFWIYLILSILTPIFGFTFNMVGMM